MAKPLNARFNVMAVGHHSADKLSFFRSLLRNEEITFVRSSESETSFANPFRGQQLTDLKAKEVKIVEVGRNELKIKNDDSVNLVMYDTLAYDDSVCDESFVDAICGHIEESHSAWRSLDLQALSAHDVLDQDTRIHCVFLFFNVHGIKEIDLYFLAKLSGKVSIIPVIEGADFITIDKRNSYLQDLHNLIENLSTTLGKSAVYDFSGTGTRTWPRSKNLQMSDPDNSLMNTPVTSNRGTSCQHISGETSKESSPNEEVSSASRTAETSLITEMTLLRSHTYSPSPEFTALLSTAADYDGSLASVSSDDRSLLDNMGDRSVSICSIETTENSNNLRHSIGLRGQECELFPPSDGAGSDNFAISKSELHRLGEFSSSEDQSHSEIFFNQETFVNVGRALSDSAIYGDTLHSGSEDMVYCSHLTAGAPTFEDIEEDMEYEDWAEGDVSSIMMDSTVLIGLPRTRGGESRLDIVEVNSLNPDLPLERELKCGKMGDDDVKKSAPINVPPEVMICKVISNLVCSSIADKKEQAACRIISSIACSHIPKNDSDVGLPYPILPRSSSAELNQNEADADKYHGAEAETNRVLDHEVRLGRGVHATESERVSEGLNIQNSVPADTRSATTFNCTSIAASTQRQLFSHAESRSDGERGSFEVTNDGLHVYHNIFFFARTEAYKTYGSESANCGEGAVQGTTDGNGRLITSNQDGSNNSDDLHSSLSASSISQTFTFGETGSTIRSDGLAYLGDADTSRLRGLLFDGKHAIALIEQTKRFSLDLFPTRPPSIEELNSTTNCCDVLQPYFSAASISKLLLSFLKYLNPAIALLSTVLTDFVDRTCASIPWVTEWIYRTGPSTLASESNVQIKNVSIARDVLMSDSHQPEGICMLSKEFAAISTNLSHTHRISPLTINTTALNNLSLSTPPSVTRITCNSSVVAPAAQQNSILGRKAFWLFICNILMCALVWSGLKGRRMVRVIPTTNETVILATAILDAPRSLMMPPTRIPNDVDVTIIDASEGVYDVLVTDPIIATESPPDTSDDIDIFNEQDFFSHTSHVDVGEMSLLHCKSLHVGDIFECLTDLPMSINHSHNAPSVWGYMQQESYRRVGDTSRKCKEGDSCGTRGSVARKTRAADRRLSAAMDSSDNDVNSVIENLEIKLVDEDASLTSNLLESMSQCSEEAYDDDSRLSACIETELSRYENKNSEITRYQIQKATVTNAHKQWDGHFLYSARTNYYLRMILQDAIRLIDDLLPNLMEMWASFIDQVEQTFKNTLAFLF